MAPNFPGVRAGHARLPKAHSLAADQKWVIKLPLEENAYPQNVDRISVLFLPFPNKQEEKKDVFWWQLCHKFNFHLHK